jgi:hypothetical protein
MSSDNIRDQLKKLDRDRRTLSNYGALNDRVKERIRKERNGLDYCLSYEMDLEAARGDTSYSNDRWKED